MKKELISNMIENFELHAQMTETQVEYWLAGDLQYFLGYNKWGNLIKSHFKSKNILQDQQS